MRTGVGLVCVLLAGGWAGAQPTTWDGDAGDGLWISQQNWDSDVVPGASSQVTIPSDAGQVQIILSAEACATLNCSSSLRLTSSSLVVSGLSTVTNMIFDGGGFTPTVDIGGDFIISGSSTCNTGQVIGSGTFQNSGVFDAFGFGINGINGASGTNTGTWNFLSSGGSLTLSNNALFSNQGIFTLTPVSVIAGESGLFSNEGTLSRTGGVGTSTIDTGFTQLGGTLSASGTSAAISLVSDGWQIVAGTLEVSNNGRLSIGGTDIARTRTLGPSAITGTGTVDIFPGNATIDWINFTTTNVSTGGVVLHSGTINLTGNLTNNGLIEGRGALMSGTGSFTNSTIGTLSIPTSNGFEFKMNATSSGAVDVRGSLILSDGAVFNQLFNIAGRQIRLHDQSTVGTLSPATPGVLHSGGTIELMGDASGLVVSTISTRLETQAGNALDVNNGTLNLSGGGSISISFIRLKNDLSPATLRFEGPLPWSINGSTSIFRTAGTSNADVNFGVINSVGPVVTIANGVEFEPKNGISMNLFSSDFAGTGTLLNNGLLNWFGGSLGCVVDNQKTMDIVPGVFGKTLKGQLNNGFFDGFVNQSAPITLDGGTISNQGTWTMESGASINPFGAGGAFHNTDTILVNDPGGSTHIIGVDLNNTGLVAVFQGHLVLTGDVLQLNQLDGTLSGGHWSAILGTSITFPRSLVQLRGPGQIDGGQAELPNLPTLQSIDNAGVARLLDTVFTGGLGLSGGSELTAAGNVTVNGDYTSTGGSKTNIEPGAKLETTGSMQVGEVDSAADEINVIAVLARNGNKYNRGVPPPSIVTTVLELWGRFGIGESGTSVVGLGGDLIMQPSARMHVSMISSGPGVNTIDMLDVSGGAVLGGELVIDATMGEFVLGEELTVLHALGSITGAFDQYRVVGLAPGEGFVGVVVGNELRITAALGCPADFTGDGILNFFDISLFLAAFSSQNPIADFSGDGVFNFFDVSIFLGAFAAGCP